MQDILKNYKMKGDDDRKVVKIKQWQVWALEFCERYDIPKRDVGRVMSVGKRYRDKLEYLEFLSGWFSDYPNLRGNPIRLLFWKLKEDGKRNKKVNMEDV